jgi:hypothetical protein
MTRCIDKLGPSLLLFLIDAMPSAGMVCPKPESWSAREIDLEVGLVKFSQDRGHRLLQRIRGTGSLGDDNVGANDFELTT